MRVAVLSETDKVETRVAATPETVKKYQVLGAEMVVQSGAGIKAGVPDAEYAAAGAIIVPTAVEAVKDADIVLRVRRPAKTELVGYKPGALLIGILDPYGQDAALKALAAANVAAFSMELMPRITRAQVMDVLSSQANLAGYRAVIDATGEYGRAMPMMMTAAGTVPAARVFVMGAGVAGLQAIATARRLGAVVTATDVRPAAKEQVESLGGKFVAVEDEEFKQAETSGGYAKEMSAAYQEKQAALVAAHIAKQDIVITTALIPGKPAPRLISDSQIATMRPGSVIVDMAADAGGNVEGTVPGESVVRHGVTIVGASNLARTLAADASALFARNLYNFLSAFWDKEQGQPVFPDDDGIVKTIRLTHGGKVVNERLTAA
jgi:NAD(P) transhydrogenase subunit alpha